jgi:hypothetical protein
MYDKKYDHETINKCNYFLSGQRVVATHNRVY